MKKIKLFFSFLFIVLIIFFIFFYIFIKSINEEDIISEIENKYDLRINKKDISKLKIIPNIEYSTTLEISDLKNRFNVGLVEIIISQPIFHTEGRLNILLEKILIKNLEFSNVEIKGDIKYYNNYIKNQNNLENLFDGTYKINGNFILLTTNEEKFIISFLKLFFENLEDKGNQKFAFSKLIEAFANESSNFTGTLKKNNNFLTSNNISMTNNENEIFIEGEYNYNKNIINMILDLSQNGEKYLTAFIEGDLIEPKVNFDKNSKFFQDINSNENNIIEESIIKFLNNFLNIND